MTNEPLSDDLKQIAIDAALAQPEAGITIDDAYELVAEGIRKIPDQLQMMLDSLVSMQAEFPMPRAGWEAFVRSIEYTNQKHGFNLVIKPELLESHNTATEAFADLLNKAIDELSDDEKKQAALNAALEKGNDPTSA